MTKEHQDQKAQGKPARAFAHYLLELENGGLHVELSEQLRDLVHSIVATGKPGALNLKITLKPDADGVIWSTANVTVTKPVPTRKKSLHYVDDAGNLARQNPAQPDLPIKAVETANVAPIRNYDPTTGVVITPGDENDIEGAVVG